jgi:hypothetical protein
LLATVQEFLSRRPRSGRPISDPRPVLEATEIEITDHLDSVLSRDSTSDDQSPGTGEASSKDEGTKGAATGDPVTAGAPPKLLPFDAKRSTAGSADGVGAGPVPAGGGADPAVALDPHDRPLTSAPRSPLRLARRARRTSRPIWRRGRLLAWIAFLLLVGLGSLVIAILLLD